MSTAEAVPSGAATHADIIARARGIAPRLRERAAQAEAERCVPKATIDDFRQAGLIRMIQPRRYGGQEMGWDVLCQVTEILAAACGSQAWIQRICCGHAQILATFPAEAQEDVWAKDHDVLISASFDPVGRGRPVDGGFIFSGRHGFSSGIDHCDWHICGGYTVGGDKKDGPYFFLVPRKDVTIIDDWHTMGLCGTGSKSFEVKDVFVPAHRLLDVRQARDGHGPGTLVNTAPVYKTPRGGITVTGFAALTVGIARGVLGDWEDYTRPRKSRGVPVARKDSARIIAAEARAQIEAAHLLYFFFTSPRSPTPSASWRRVNPSAKWNWRFPDAMSAMPANRRWKPGRACSMRRAGGHCFPVHRSNASTAT